MTDSVSRFASGLKKNGLRIALAESITCGVATSYLAGAPGTSEIFSGSIICYDAEVKTDLMGVSRRLIEKHTAESSAVTIELARSLKKLVDADIHAAVTGLAAPGGSETARKPVGTVFVAFIFKGRIYRIRKRFYGPPAMIRRKAARLIFDFISRKLSL